MKISILQDNIYTQTDGMAILMTLLAKKLYYKKLKKKLKETFDNNTVLQQ